MFSFVRSKINQVIPASPLREGLRSYSRVMSLEQQNLKTHYLANIKIYNTGIIKDPVHDFETLKLLYELDQCLANRNKQEAIKCYTKFILNQDETKYGDDFGKAKEHLGSVLRSYLKQTKVTPLDILESLGFSKTRLLEKGVLETTLEKTKTCVSSTVFEIMVMEALPEKYEFVEKVIYCQDGAVKVKCLNLTGQSNPDFVLNIRNANGELMNIGFDSKAQKLDAFMANLEKNGFKYQIVTLGSNPDSIITENFVYKNLIKDKNFIVNKNNIISKNSETQETINEDKYMTSPLVPLMFISTKDIANNVAKMQKKALPHDDTDS